MTVEFDVTDKWCETKCHMAVSLDGIERHIGKRVRDHYNGDGGIYVDYPCTRAKKLFKLMRQFASPEDSIRVEQYMKGSHNDKLIKAWRDSV